MIDKTEIEELQRSFDSLLKDFERLQAEKRRWIVDGGHDGSCIEVKAEALREIQKLRAAQAEAWDEVEVQRREVERLQVELECGGPHSAAEIHRMEQNHFDETDTYQAEIAKLKEENAQLRANVHPVVQQYVDMALENAELRLWKKHWTPVVMRHLKGEA